MRQLAFFLRHSVCALHLEHSYLALATFQALRCHMPVRVCHLVEASSGGEAQTHPGHHALLPDGTPRTEIAAERKLRICARSRRLTSWELANREDYPRLDAGLSGCGR